MRELIDREDALDAIKFAELGREYDEVEKVQIFNPWHRVEEELPDDSRDVIIFTASKIIGVGSFIRPNWYQWYSGGGLPVDVTYWMPLPEPPKEDADGMPEWCVVCPNKEYCPIRYSAESWYCAGKDILREPKEEV